MHLQCIIDDNLICDLIFNALFFQWLNFFYCIFWIKMHLHFDSIDSCDCFSHILQSIFQGHFSENSFGVILEYGLYSKRLSQSNLFCIMIWCGYDWLSKNTWNFEVVIITFHCVYVCVYVCRIYYKKKFLTQTERQANDSSLTQNHAWISWWMLL